MDRSWILVGMMGSGKSSIGRLLADVSGREFLDTDSLLVRRLGRPITQIFRLYGETAFRDHEARVLHDLLPGPSVIATGGGTVLREGNWDRLRELGTTVYLQANLGTLAERLERTRSKRPLLAGDDWIEKIDEILTVRHPIYIQADHTIVVDGLSTEQTAEAVRRKLEGA